MFKTKKRWIIKENPGDLYKLIEDVTDKIFDAHPFSFLASDEKDYARQLGIREGDICKIRWTHLSRQFFGKVKLHFGAVFCFYLCAPSP